MRGWSVLRTGGRRAATTPQVQCSDRGLGRWPRGHVKEGTVPDATGITPVESVQKQDGKVAGGTSPHKKIVTVGSLLVTSSALAYISTD